jgi:hypothetical protein
MFTVSVTELILRCTVPFVLTCVMRYGPLFWLGWILSRLQLSMCHGKHVLFKEDTYGDVAISIFSSTSQTSQFRLSDTSLRTPISA